MHLYATMRLTPWGGLGFRRVPATAAPRAPAETRTLSDESIPSLVERARSGDSEAYGELFARFQVDVVRVCRRMLGAGPAAEDATSEVFLRARRSLGDFDAGRPLRPWLQSIAAHYCVDLLRRRSTEARLFDERELRSEELTHPGPSPLVQALQAEERAVLLGAIDGLDARYRLPLVLRYFSELDYRTIAEVLGVTREQVGTLLFRAKRRLRQRLADPRSTER